MSGKRHLLDPRERLMPESSAPTLIRPIWIASYPRSGNTFLRIILQNCFRLPTYSVYYIQGQNFPDPSAEALESAPALPNNWRELVTDNPAAQVSLIKTHDLPAGTEPAIYIVRDGRAAIDSYFHYHQKFAFDKPTLTEVIAGACQFGSWSAHYQAWRPQVRLNTLFLRYEDLVERPDTIIPQLATFLKTEPIKGHLPTFEELRSQNPSFFRRGQNQDFANRWTTGQMALFNALHGAVMQELGYPVTSTTFEASAIVELARSTARLHESYLEQLGKLGTNAALCQQLLTDIKRLQESEARLAEKAGELDRLLRRPWVKLGMALRAVRTNQKRVQSSRFGAKSQTGETQAPRRQAPGSDTLPA